MSNETIQRLTASKNTLKKAALAIRALNHPFRTKMIEVINENQEITVTDLYVKLREQQSVVSQHLRILRSVKVVVTRREGKYIFYSLSPETIEKILNTASELVN